MDNPSSNTQGVTLIECLIGITLTVGILGIGIPMFITQLEKTHLEQEIQQLYHGLQMAHLQAVSHQHFVTVCGSATLTQCDHQWSKGFIVYLDRSVSGTLTPTDVVISTHRVHWPKGSITFKGSLHRPYVRFSPQGRSTVNGTFTLHSPHLAYQGELVINDSARIRMHPHGV